MLPPYSPQNLLLKQGFQSQSTATLFFQLVRLKAMKSSLTPLLSNASVSSVGFIFRMHPESDYFLPSLLLPLWPKPPLSPIWFTCSSFRPGLLASTPFLSTIPEVKVRDLIQSPSALWHNLLLLAFRFIPLQPHCYSSVISSVLPLGLYTYCSLCLECSSSRWPCGLLPYFLQFSSQMQFQYLTNLYKIATASHYLTPYHLGLY